MKDQFVTYEIAVKLKELGFDEDCFAGYNDSKVLLIYYPNECFYGYCDINYYKNCESIEDIKAPLWQQAFSFVQNIIDLYEEEFVLTLTKEEWLLTNNTYYYTNEEALLKLIELCQLK